MADDSFLGRVWQRLKAAITPLPSSRISQAVFIDGDGVSPSDARRVVTHLSSEGRLSCLRVYANLTGGNGSAWSAFARDHGAVARHLPSVAAGKNGTDIALAIDATELLLTRRYDSFVIVANDADFTPLVHRLREQGKLVIGYGSRGAAQSFRQACDRFIDLRSLEAPRAVAADPTALWTRQPTDAAELVRRALTDLSPDDTAVPLTLLGEQLKRLQPGFDTRTYSRRRLRDLLNDLPGTEVLEIKGTPHARRSELPE